MSSEKQTIKTSEAEDQVVLELQNETGAILTEVVSKSQCIQKSKFLDSIFQTETHKVVQRDSKDYKCQELSLRIYEVSVKTSHEESLRTLLQYLNGKTLDLNSAHIDHLLKQAHAWCLSDVEYEIALYLRKQIEPALKHRFNPKDSKSVTSLRTIAQVLETLEDAGVCGLDWNEDIYRLEEDCSKWVIVAIARLYDHPPFNLPVESRDEIPHACCREHAYNNINNPCTKCKRLRLKILMGREKLENKPKLWLKFVKCAIHGGLVVLAGIKRPQYMIQVKSDSYSCVEMPAMDEFDISTMEGTVVLELQKQNGEVLYKTVNRDMLSQNSDYFKAFFAHSIPTDIPQKERLPSTEAKNLEIFRLVVQMSDDIALNNLMDYLHGHCLELTSESLAEVMKQADSWCLDDFPNCIIEFLRNLLEPILKKKCPPVTTEAERKLSCIIQILRFLKAAASYGLEIWSNEGFALIREDCLEWLARNFDKVLTLPRFYALSKETQETSIKYCKRNISDNNCVAFCNKCIVLKRKILSSAKKKGSSFVLELLQFGFCFAINRFEKVLSSESFSQMVTQYNDMELEEFFEGIADHLDSDSAPTIFLALHEQLLQEKNLQRTKRLKVKEAEIVSAKIEKLPILKRRVQEYCQKHALSVLRSEGYKSLSLPDQTRVYEELNIRSIDSKDTSSKTGCSFIVVNEKTPKKKAKTKFIL
eukprot:g6784.t1